MSEIDTKPPEHTLPETPSDPRHPRLRKRDVSDRMIAANRANAKKSRGPVTPEGLKRCREARLNAAQMAGAIPLSCENDEEFRKIIVDLERQFKPRNTSERYMVNKLGATIWRDLRLMIFEKRIQDHQVVRQYQMNPNAGEPMDEAADAMHHLADDSHILAHISRAESRFARIIAHYSAQLEHIRSTRDKSEGQKTKKCA
jgi:hypothetical protein